jgi:hypothetical protein
MNKTEAESGVIGVDLGFNGAIVCLYGDYLRIEDMPIIETKVKGKKRKEYDIEKIDEILSLMHFRQTTVFIEKAQIRPHGFNIQGNLSLARCEAIFSTIFTLRIVPFRLVTPKEWQKFFKISGKKDDTKKQSVEIAKNLYGVELVTPRGRLLDGRADALLIAKYGKTIIEEERRCLVK